MLNFSQPALNFDVTVDILRSSIIALQFHSSHLGDPAWKSLEDPADIFGLSLYKSREQNEQQCVGIIRFNTLGTFLCCDAMISMSFYNRGIPVEQRLEYRHWSMHHCRCGGCLVPHP